MQPCLEARFGKILGSWLDLDSTESADLEHLPKEGGTGVEVTTATSELKTLFTATRGSSEEEDETKLKEDSYIRLERKERANTALIRNMATETQRPGHTNLAFQGQNLYPYNPTHSILRLCWGWILLKVFSLYFVFALLPGDFCVWYTELGDSSWGLIGAQVFAGAPRRNIGSCGSITEPSELELYDPPIALQEIE
ncbi:hypothetical protein DFH09DRAFT_1112122 [Mycena vulgaris]|nr:hypothetical protein DFH09DRAFT_1112122 [Mycena vulgaris]